jgi:hypothetical protein
MVIFDNDILTLSTAWLISSKHMSAVIGLSAALELLVVTLGLVFPPTE